MFSEFLYSVPQESFSRKLDKDVARTEYPYGKPCYDDFMEVERGAKRGKFNDEDRLKRSKD